MQVLSASQPREARRAAITLGEVQDTFTVTTESADQTPDIFSFRPQSGVAPDTLITSESITVTGINLPVTINVSGGEYALDDGPFTQTSGTVRAGQRVQVRLTSASTFVTPGFAFLNIGTISNAFVVTTQADSQSDSTPNPFLFEDRDEVSPSQLMTSNTITVTGIDTAIPLLLTTGSYSLNGAAFTAVPTVVNNNDTLVLRLLAPSGAGETLSTTLILGSVFDSFSVSTADQGDVPDAFTVGGSIIGLAGSGLVLQNNGGDNLAISTNGPFTFATPLPDISTYSLSVLNQPDTPSQNCVVSQGAGTLAGANITDINIVCTTKPYTVGGTVSGLAGSGFVLQNNGSDDLAIDANGVFTFATALEDLLTYAVSVLSPPTGQACSVSQGSGALVGAAITDVDIVCVDNIAPGVTMTFPPAQSLTDGDSLIVRGTAADNPGGSGIATLSVNGIEATTNDNFATWTVDVPLNPGQNTLTVATTDLAGNSAPLAAQAAVKNEVLLYLPIATVLDSANNRALVVDFNLAAVIAVDLINGQRVILSR